MDDSVLQMLKEESVGPINTPLETKKGEPAPTADWTLDMWYEYCQRSSFARAAYTRYDELVASGIPEEEIMVVRVDSEDDFIEKWNSWTQLESVQGVEIFSHGNGGEPNFYTGSSKNIFTEKILPKLNWHGTETCADPYMIFYGCNTSIGFESQAIADYYGITLYGNSHVTNFTDNSCLFSAIDTFGVSHDVYLCRFMKSHNEVIEFLEKGLKYLGWDVIPHEVYKPQVTKE